MASGRDDGCRMTRPKSAHVVVALALVLGVAYAGCGDDEPNDKLFCSGETCNLKCEDGTEPPCQATCEKGADCDLDCNGIACDLDCAAKSNCSADCTVAGGCDTSCEGQSTCTVDCTNASDCGLDCAGG